MSINRFSLLAIAGYMFCLYQLGYVWCWTTNEEAIGGLLPHLFVMAAPLVGWAMGLLSSEEDE